MAIWIIQAVRFGRSGRVERIRWQLDGGAEDACVGDLGEVEGHVAAAALCAGDKVYTLKPSECGTEVVTVRRVEYSDGAQSIEPEDVAGLPGL